MPAVSTTTASYSTPLWLHVSSAVMRATFGHSSAKRGEAGLGGRPVASDLGDGDAGRPDAEQLDGVDAVRGGVVVEPVGDLGRHAVGGGHLGRAHAQLSGGLAEPEPVGRRPLGVVAHQGEPGRAPLHGAELEQGEVLGLVDDHVAVGGGDALDPGPDLVEQGAVARLARARRR